MHLLPIIILASSAVIAADQVLFLKDHPPGPGYCALLIEDRIFDDFVIEADLRRPSSVTHYGIVFRYRDDENLYRLVLRTTQRDFRVEKVIEGQSDYATTRYARFPSCANRWYHVRLVARGRHVEVWIDGERHYVSDAFTELASGRAGVTVYDPAPGEFDSPRITSVDGRQVLFTDDFDGGRLEGWAAACTKAEWAVQPKVEKMESREDFVERYTFRVCEGTGRNQSMFEFPGITKLHHGELLTLFVEENQHGTPPWAAMPSSGKLWMARSADLGRTWAERTLFLDTPLDDRHAYTLQLSNGDVLAFFWVQTVAFGVRGILNYCARSTDGGATWEDPVRFRSGRPVWPQPPAPGIRGSSSLTVPPIELSDGTLAMPIHCVGSDGRPPADTGLLRSTDHGRTWGDYSTVAFDKERRISFVEPAVVRLRSGKWIAVMRTEVPINPGTTHPYKLGPTMTCTSTDEGRTWGEPALMPLDFTRTGSTAPFILQTQTGVVVFAVNTGTAFSYDDGETWVPQNLRCGYYPNLVEIAPGTLATLACGMTGRVLSLSKPTVGTWPVSAVETRHVEQREPRAVLPREALSSVTITGTPRAIRVRPPWGRKESALLAHDKLPMLAVARVESNGEPIVAGFFRSPDGSWLAPFTVAKAQAMNDPVLVQRRDGDLLCAFNCADRAMLSTSDDRGGSWTNPAPLTIDGRRDGARITAPPVQDRGGSWLAAVELRGQAKSVVLRAAEASSTWRTATELPAGGEEPSLAVARDGRWVVVAKKRGADDLLVTVSQDRGATWSEWRTTGLKGRRPEVVELLDTLFVVTAEGKDGGLRAAFAWDELGHFIKRGLACGYCLRARGHKVLARGSGPDVAGELNDVAQGPLTDAEISAARQAVPERVVATDNAFVFGGDWKRLGEATDQPGFESSDTKARVEVKFSGRAVFLVHDVSRDGRLVEVKIDGREYPPVDMKGKARRDVSTCLACDLPPGRHQLVLRPLLPWRAAKMVIRGVEVTE